MNRYYGIDFSGSQSKWQPNVRTSNVWIAEIIENGELSLTDLRRVQQLPGNERPFDRLAALLAAGEYRAAAIDAPFSVPQNRVPTGGHASVLARVGNAIVPPRDFMSGPAFVRLFSPAPIQREYRQTERYWSELGLNVRSTMWHCNKAEGCVRGGAEMASACIMLLHKARRPIWPLCDDNAGGSLIEAFPMAQLQQWQLPFTQYDGAKGLQRRQQIITVIGQRVNIEAHEEQLMQSSADALDAVLCAFAAIAVAKSAVVVPLDPNFSATEGWISVHS